MDTESSSNRSGHAPASKKRLGSFFFSAGIGLIIGFLIWGPFFDPDFRAGHKNCASHYGFVNPEPDCETLEDSIGRLKNAERDIEALIAVALKNGKAGRVSVFARDLTTLQYVSVNELELYSPASLMKIPIMLAYFRIAESDPGVLAKQLPYQGGEDMNLSQELQQFDQETGLVVGRSYSIENLIERMIKYSDNNATSLLLNNIDQGFLERIMLEIGLRIPKQDNLGNRDFVTAKSFAAIMRFLYNSTFLTRESSNKALKLLTESTFEQGARFVVPKPTTMAEKYGERSVLDEKGFVVDRELHECGLVYAKNHPYSFCVFTEGDNFIDLLDTLRQVVKSLQQNISAVDWAQRTEAIPEPRR